MAEVIHNAEQIQIGQFKYNPSSLNVGYTIEKIKMNYSKFLSTPVVIEYEDKSTTLKKVISCPPKVEQKKEEAKETEEETAVSWERSGYLEYDLIDLLNDL